jgi:hypothetical protein
MNKILRYFQLLYGDHRVISEAPSRPRHDLGEAACAALREGTATDLDVAFGALLPALRSARLGQRSRQER